MTIERSAGYSTGLSPLNEAIALGGRPRPGGGGRGLTEELDTLVAEASERLAAEYGRDVVIRFNSDRRSGGAYLKDVPTQDCLVGINGGLYPPKASDLGMTEGEYIDKRIDDRAWANSLPVHLAVHTNVRAKALVDPEMATQGRYHPDPTDDDPYSYVEHESVDAAIEWLRANVRI